MTLPLLCTYSQSAENWTLERAWKQRDQEVSNEAALRGNLAEAQNSVWIWLIPQAKRGFAEELYWTSSGMRCWWTTCWEEKLYHCSPLCLIFLFFFFFPPTWGNSLGEVGGWSVWWKVIKVWVWFFFFFFLMSPCKDWPCGVSFCGASPETQTFAHHCLFSIYAKHSSSRSTATNSNWDIHFFFLIRKSAAYELKFNGIFFFFNENYVFLGGLYSFHILSIIQIVPRTLNNEIETHWLLLMDPPTVSFQISSQRFFCTLNGL